MLANIHLKNVGPASEMELELTERLNLITGDNGLGKSFLLAVAWHALTQSWADTVIRPNPTPSVPEISCRYDNAASTFARRSNYTRATEQWFTAGTERLGPEPKTDSTDPDCLVVYARVDGGFSIFDPLRTGFTDASNFIPPWDPIHQTFPQTYFSATDVWEGNSFCEGLIRDWASWHLEKNNSYSQLLAALRTLSPPGEAFEAGELRKVSINDPKRYPTLKMPYGEEVPISQASAGIRRIIALAYLLVWSWQEHVATSQLIGAGLVDEIVFLIDEVEAHLHPQWQRRIVPALLDVMDAITGDHKVNVQLIGTTHSPLVMASTESRFDPAIDSWFDLDLDRETRKVVLQKRSFEKYGDYSSWLKSDAFDLKEARSLEAEEAIMAALAVLREPMPDRTEMERVDGLLKAALGDTDRFWMRWSEFYEKMAAAA